MKKGANLLLRVLISILYIVQGGGSCAVLVGEIFGGSFSPSILPALGLSVAMLLAGVFGLFRIKPLSRRILGAVILVLAVMTLISTFPGDIVSSLTSVILGLIYIVYI